MARQGRRARKRPSRDYVLVALGAVVVVALVAFAVAALRPQGPQTITAFVDIHGFAIDPEDSSRLYVATHHGLVVGTNDGNWTRAGPADDLMGFSAHPHESGTFWVSGHPEARTIDYHNLGVRKSTDGGQTWTDLALRGVDFHAMTISPVDPDRLWGVYQGKIHRSGDGGATWSVAGDAPSQLSSVTASPTDAQTLFAATRLGILRSLDGGASWAAWSPTAGYAIAWSRDGTAAYLATGDRLLASRDAGSTWAPTSLDPDGGTLAYLAVDPRDARIAYAATYEAAIYKTKDAGATWTMVKPAA